MSSSLTVIMLANYVFIVFFFQITAFYSEEMGSLYDFRLKGSVVSTVTVQLLELDRSAFYFIHGFFIYDYPD